MSAFLLPAARPAGLRARTDVTERARKLDEERDSGQAEMQPPLARSLPHKKLSTHFKTLSSSFLSLLLSSHPLLLLLLLVLLLLVLLLLLLQQQQQGGYKFHQYTVVGRHLPTAADPEPTLFRMKLWATDDARARSKFWYFLAKLRKVKKANGQIVACNEIFEKRPTTVKNFGIWVRYQSRTGSHNM